MESHTLKPSIPQIGFNAGGSTKDKEIESLPIVSQMYENLQGTLIIGLSIVNV